MARKAARIIFTSKEFLLLLVVPTVLTVVAVLIAQIPRWVLEPPKYDYVYVICDRDCYSQAPDYYNGSWRVPSSSSTHYSAEVSSNYSSGSTGNTYYVYDVETGNKQALSLSEVNQLSITNGDVSPDGFRFESEYGDSLYGTNVDIVLRKNNVTLKQDIVVTSIYQIKILGWVDNE